MNETSGPPCATSSPTSEQADAGGVLVIIILLCFSFAVAYLLHRFSLIGRYVSAAATTIVIGLIGGLFVRYVLQDVTLQQLVAFNRNIFFIVILPPIIFNAGLDTDKRRFLINLVSILMFAFGGVVVNTFAFGLLVWAVSEANLTGVQLSLLECLIFGAIISSTDPITTLAVFKVLEVDVNLYSNVFGESVLNDSVSIVLYRSLVRFETRSVTATQIVLAVIQFLYIFFGSLGIGVVVALILSLILRFTAFEEFPRVELALVIVIAYSSYLICEVAQFSGIVAIFFCGVVFSHFGEPNLTLASQAWSRNLFGMFAFIAETFTFLTLGIGIFEQSRVFAVLLTLWSLLFLLVARAIAVFSLSAVLNIARPTPHIPWKHQVVLWHAGLRGAVAFAIASDLTVPHTAELQSTISIIVVASVIVLGGTTFDLLRLLRIPAEHEEVSPHWLERLAAFERLYLRPLFTTTVPPRLAPPAEQPPLA